jgi:hypothetical protein
MNSNQCIDALRAEEVHMRRVDAEAQTFADRDDPGR